MLDPITLDQIRAFVTVVDEGSFSAAARKLQRVQSAVSHAIANLEAQLGVALWDRSTRVPKLTDQGRVLLACARRVISETDGLRRVARGLVGGLEPEVAICVDAAFPLTALVDLCREFAEVFPTVELRVHTEIMAAVTARVLDGTCHLGVANPAESGAGLTRHHLSTVQFVTVASKDHPLAKAKGRIPTERLAEHVQIVLSERSPGKSPDRGVLSPITWRVADLTTKHALIRAGLGWGNLPEHVARADLAKGTLVRLQPEAWGEVLISLAVIHRPELDAGPATQWLLRRMKELCLRDVGPEPSPDKPPRSKRKKKVSAPEA